MNNEKFMSEAIKEAKKADFPYGAVIVKDNEIISRAGTAKKESLDPTAHAEITVIREACNKLKTTNLRGAILYSTCEPCPMCFTAAWWANISEIIFGMDLEDSSRLMGKELEVKSEFLNKAGGNKIKMTKNYMREEILSLFDK